VEVIGKTNHGQDKVLQFLVGLCELKQMRVIRLFVVFVSFSVVAFAQMLDGGENYSPKSGEASDPLYGNRPARTMSQREFSQLYERQVVHPAMDEGALMGAVALDLQTGEISICEKAPEPSSLSLLAVGGVVVALRRRKRA
jgi:hypothetical protein